MMKYWKCPNENRRVVMYLLPLITKPDISMVAISSLVNPISPLLGIRLLAFTYSAIAAPSPGKQGMTKIRGKEKNDSSTLK